MLNNDDDDVIMLRIMTGQRKNKGSTGELIDVQERYSVQNS